MSRLGENLNSSFSTPQEKVINAVQRSSPDGTPLQIFTASFPLALTKKRKGCFLKTSYIIKALVFTFHLLKCDPEWCLSLPILSLTPQGIKEKIS